MGSFHDKEMIMFISKSPQIDAGTLNLSIFNIFSVVTAATPIASNFITITNNTELVSKSISLKESVFIQHEPSLLAQIR